MCVTCSQLPPWRPPAPSIPPVQSAQGPRPESDAFLPDVSNTQPSISVLTGYLNVTTRLLDQVRLNFIVFSVSIHPHFICSLCIYYTIFLFFHVHRLNYC